ncbi:unnamed protein product [Rotaria sordida]|uniref:Uncharacterized protein n=1 Tax=Rotaria sordida TaxID=392033 RepID=A0A818ZAC4_9BILA|nr:unnamed protein product [Rotaria sordida]CAF1130536.1 unnamed protein product [Rotaria sordida]CAF3634573.1 unnamed protein product [Rotaria sordida]CAF3765975.1 unnamed protein product [Rotaria sordida]
MSFIMAWRGRLLNIYPSFRHSSSLIRDTIQGDIRITGVIVHFIDDSDNDSDETIIAQESNSVTLMETENQ